MDLSRVAVSGVASLIVVLVLLTGPPLGIVELPSATSDDIGTGNATVSVESVPDTVTVERGADGTNVYYLRVPSATIEVSELRENPILDYSIAIQGMGFTRGSIHLLGDVGDGTHDISLDETTFEPDRIDQQRYEAELTLTLRGETEIVLVEKLVTVEVVE